MSDCSDILYLGGRVRWSPSLPLIVSYGRPHRRLHCRTLCALILCFEDMFRGSGSLEAARVSGSVLLFKDRSRSAQVPVI